MCSHQNWPQVQCKFHSPGFKIFTLPNKFPSTIIWGKYKGLIKRKAIKEQSIKRKRFWLTCGWVNGWKVDELRTTNMGHWRAARTCAGVTRAHHLKIFSSSELNRWKTTQCLETSWIKYFELPFQIDPCKTHTLAHRLCRNLKSESKTFYS